jgi:DNA replication and repair protein RecF
MSLTALRLEDLRCLRQADLEFDPGLNLISGDNGSGKTSLLEAIYLLGRGRSFRTRHTEQLIRHSAPRFWVHGRTIPEPGHSIGIECGREQTMQIRVDRLPVASRSELSEIFPVQVIDPGIHRLVEDGPPQRRRWLDWAVFHVEPGFVRQWQGYTRALKQRNAALQAHADETLWDGEVIRLGDQLTQARSSLIRALQPYWSAVLKSLGAVEASLGFFQGWSREQSLGESLSAHRAGDRERGITSVGPHRFEVLLRLEGRPVREVLSRGQQKLLGVAMALCMVRYIAEVAGRNSTLLLDDPAAELDTGRTDALLQTVRGLGAQLVVTALHPEDSVLGVPDAVFHVEHGGVERL